MMKARQGFVVEFCGIPGAGKSHLAARLVQELRDAPILAYDERSNVTHDVKAFVRLRRKAGLAGRELTAPGSVARSVLTRIVLSGQQRPLDVLGRGVQWLVTQRLIRDTWGRPGVHVFDEGVVQALWSIGLRGTVEDVLLRLERSPDVALPDLVVVVDVPSRVAGSRLAARGSTHSRVQDGTGPGLLNELERGRLRLERIIRWWTTAIPSIGVLRVDNDVTQPALRTIQERVQRALTRS